MGSPTLYSLCRPGSDDILSQGLSCQTLGSQSLLNQIEHIWQWVSVCLCEEIEVAEVTAGPSTVIQLQYHVQRRGSRARGAVWFFLIHLGKLIPGCH
jgi:hypothetical protein